VEATCTWKPAQCSGCAVALAVGTWVAAHLHLTIDHNLLHFNLYRIVPQSISSRG
jgi:hypothetical protein